MDLPIRPILCDVVGGYLGQTLTPEVAARLTADVLTRCYNGPISIEGVAPQRVGSYLVECSRLADDLDGLKALHLQHWRETERHRQGLEFNPDYNRALDLEWQGRYLLIVARHIDGALVGNYGLYISRSMHTQTLMATEDTLFLAKEHRRGRLGISMIRYAEHALEQLGVRELNVSVKLVNEVGPMIERMGYEPVGTQYTKILGGDHVRT
ncbi:GNAT family N-acetyltransferase [Candidimonas nitroreducens]|uniref:N-acetyltransferase domain-containing protein n=1 Tax=Candidimonas nitroreducens TaxID=683354 RepID=A0A225M3N1_9BURK|nr:GNAT family N-acetyltransferase [Candidimonas nitroreducens]OWT55282.1 hypothetical protein CEY11_21470 [Candidimonas nitroreducens]